MFVDCAFRCRVASRACEPCTAREARDARPVEAWPAGCMRTSGWVAGVHRGAGGTLCLVMHMLRCAPSPCCCKSFTEQLCMRRTSLTCWAFRYFLCVKRTSDGVLRSGWATPGSDELLRLSAVKAKLAGMCMFGGLDRHLADEWTRTFLKHRDNVSLLLQAQEQRTVQNVIQTGGAGDAGAEDEQFEESPAERALAILLAGSEKLEQASSPRARSSYQQDGTPDAQMQGDGDWRAADSLPGTDSLPGAAHHGAAGLRALQQETAESCDDRSMRVEIPTAHRCRHNVGSSSWVDEEATTPSVSTPSSLVSHSSVSTAAPLPSSTSSGILTSRSTPLAWQASSSSFCSRPFMAPVSTPPCDTAAFPRRASSVVSSSVASGDERMKEVERRAEAEALKAELAAALSEKEHVVSEQEQVSHERRVAQQTVQSHTSQAGGESAAGNNVEILLQEAQAIIEEDDGEALVALLKERGAALNALYPQLHGQSLLHCVCERRMVQCCRELLKANADPNVLGTNSQKYSI